jgi:hypothetical protein
MILFLRRPWVSLVALTAYLGVHVLAAALHHHHGAEDRPGSSPAAHHTGFPPEATSPAATDADGEDTCLLCSVLHLARSLPTACSVEAVTALASEPFSAVPIIRPHPLETATHSRAPPAA